MKKTLIIILLIASVLRLYGLELVPVSLFGDELDVGYHAYSVLNTGKDYSGNFMPLNFQSLAEWRTPLYLYSVVPTVAIFGISPLGVRLPAAIFGILGVWGIYLLSKEIFKKETPALIAAAVLAFSPWHIQYSRAAFEVTMLTTFIIFGLYFFFRSFKNGKFLSISAILLISTPLIYATAKLFMPIFLLLLLFLYKKQLLLINRNYLKYALVFSLLVGLPTAYATLNAGGTQRFGYVSVFTDPTRESQIGTERNVDLKAGLTNSSINRLFHNKFTFWLDNVSGNYLESLSNEFLFLEGDRNLRHSIDGMGMLYKIEFIGLIAGLVYLFAKFKNNKKKVVIGSWIVLGVLPSAITRDGGGHGTRLIIILPPLVMLISYGLYKLVDELPSIYRNGFVLGYFMLFLLSFIFYQHSYWIHNPFESEQWWHAGYEESIQYIKSVEQDYDQVIISDASEPPWIFFAGWWEYPPSKWQENIPDRNKDALEGFGEVTNIDKFYFGSISDEIGIYGLRNYINERTLYMASANEIGADLILEPDRTPPDIALLKTIAYPSGDPAFYVFGKSDQ